MLPRRRMGSTIMLPSPFPNTASRAVSNSGAAVRYQPPTPRTPPMLQARWLAPLGTVSWLPDAVLLVIMDPLHGWRARPAETLVAVLNLGHD